MLSFAHSEIDLDYCKSLCVPVTKKVLYLKIPVTKRLFQLVTAMIFIQSLQRNLPSDQWSLRLIVMELCSMQLLVPVTNSSGPMQYATISSCD